MDGRLQFGSIGRELTTFDAPVEVDDLSDVIRSHARDEARDSGLERRELFLHGVAAVDEQRYRDRPWTTDQ